MRAFATLIVSAAVMAGFWALNGAAQTSEGVFTEAQAQAGRTAYAANCGGCHQQNLSGSGDQVPLAGTTFMASWGRRPIKEFYDDIRANMPYGRAGSLDATTYQNITAFILSANGAKPGSKPLDGTSTTRISAIASGQIPADIANPPRRANAESAAGRAPAMKLGHTLVGNIKEYRPVTEEMLVH